jgi:hypothetical protein
VPLLRLKKGNPSCPYYNLLVSPTLFFSFNQRFQTH